MHDSRVVLLAVAAGLLFVCSPERETAGKPAAPVPLRQAVSPSFGRGPCAEDPRIGRVGFRGTPPVLVRRVEPSMERVAPGLRGIVIVEVIIDEEGKPCSVAILRSLRRDADEAVVNAVRQWRFVPAKLNGKGWPVAYNVAVAVTS